MTAQEALDISISNKDTHDRLIKEAFEQELLKVHTAIESSAKLGNYKVEVQIFILAVVERIKEDGFDILPPSPSVGIQRITNYWYTLSWGINL